MIIAAIATTVVFILACLGLKYVPLDGTRNDQVRMARIECEERVTAIIERNSAA